MRMGSPKERRMDTITHHDYLELLRPWVRAARNHLHRLPGDSDCFCYGIGTHNHWAMQANNTALGAFAILAVTSDTEVSSTGASREELLEIALGMLRFALRGHIAGPGRCVDGRSWGHSWISVLCIDRMMHAVEALEEHLTEADRDLMKRVLISESDWLLDEYEIVAGLIDNNKPESNMWNGATLHRTALLAPDAPRVAEYREKGTRFLLNAISVPGDALSRAEYDSRALADWHVGPNFFDSFACNHHGYLNVGYMVITLSNAAMLHFSFRHHGVEAPSALYHHVPELWQLVKTCTFPDGRLLRIGGDTRVRYCYCQDYAIPVWLMMRDRYGEKECEPFEAGWLDQVRKEMAANGDGSFLGERMRGMATVSPLYYTRLEGDRAVTLSMGAYWRRRYGEFADSAHSTTACPAPLGQWSDRYHGACLVRGKRRFASWTWCAAQRPQGMCLPPDASSMAEWRTNLAGRITGMGLLTIARVAAHTETPFPGGFVTCGKVILRSRTHYAEGESDLDIATSELAFAALPDDRTIVGLQRARPIHRVYLREVKGLFLQIPNDLFNGYAREYHSARGIRRLAGCPGSRETLFPGEWLNVDGRLGVRALYGGKDLVLCRADRRRITIRSGSWEQHALLAGGELYVDEICLGAWKDEPCVYEAGEDLYDLGFVVQANVSPAETGLGEPDGPCAGPPGVLTAHTSLRAVRIIGADGVAYLFAANFGDREIEAGFAVGSRVIVECVSRPGEVGLSGGIAGLRLGPWESRLYTLRFLS